nr:MAG TPA: hypothetical protein [Caudoviricetes sp.]
MWRGYHFIRRGAGAYMCPAPRRMLLSFYSCIVVSFVL